MSDDLLPCELFTAAEVRRLDRCAIDEHGIPSAELVRRAGAAAFALAFRQFPILHRVAVVCGTGNNGADGYVFARLAHQAGLSVTVMQIGDITRQSPDAVSALRDLTHAGLVAQPFSRDGLLGRQLIVDAMFGTGLDRPLIGESAHAVADINDSAIPVLALDIPSGLNADTGAVMGATVKALLTITFVALKRGMFTGEGRDYCGRIEYRDLGISPSVFTAMAASARRLTSSCVPRLLLPRLNNSHKGCYGHVLVVGGNLGMPGAVRIAGEAALRVGAGLASVATRTEHAASVGCGRPELMCRGIDNPEQLEQLLAQASVLAIGPGLGRDDWSRATVEAALAASLPLVVDADALNWLSENPQRRANWILTPHPGEAARLLGCSTSKVQADRFAACAEIQHRYGGVCVLKGAGSLVYDGRNFGVCDLGNPRMATAGMGDALTGVIAGLAAQALPSGRTLYEIACAAVRLHASAADAASETGKLGLIATDIFPFLRAWANEI